MTGQSIPAQCISVGVDSNYRASITNSGQRWLPVISKRPHWETQTPHPDHRQNTGIAVRAFPGSRPDPAQKCRALLDRTTQLKEENASILSNLAKNPVPKAIRTDVFQLKAAPPVFPPTDICLSRLSFSDYRKNRQTGINTARKCLPFQTPGTLLYGKTNRDAIRHPSSIPSSAGRKQPTGQKETASLSFLLCDESLLWDLTYRQENS